MKYFTDCKTKEEAKAKYRQLAKKMHPDGGGDGKDMIELQKQYEAYTEPVKVGPSTNSFNFNFGYDNTHIGGQSGPRESIYDRYYKQNSGNPYFQSQGTSYTFYPDNDGELNRLCAENARLKQKINEYESVITTKKINIERLENHKHILEMEIRSTQTHSRHLTKEIDELRKTYNERLLNFPNTPWETIKHLFKQLFESRADDKTK